MKRYGARFGLYGLAALSIVGGGLMIKFVEPTSGAALIAGGTLLFGMLQKQVAAPKADKDEPGKSA